MAIDLDLAGVDGVADAEAAAGSLKAKLHAIRAAVSAHDKTDTDDDESEPEAVDWLSKPLEKGALASARPFFVSPRAKQDRGRRVEVSHFHVCRPLGCLCRPAN